MRINNFTNYGFLDMDHDEATTQLDKVTSYDAMYDTSTATPQISRGLYRVLAEVDKDVRAQFKRMRSLIQRSKLIPSVHANSVNSLHM